MINQKRLAALVLALLAMAGFSRGETLFSLPGQTRITRGGVYRIAGKMESGQLLVDCGPDEAVTLILDGVEIASQENPAIEVTGAREVLIILEAGSGNVLSAGRGAKAAIFSKADLSLEGTGALSISAADGHGIQGKESLTIRSGSARIRAQKDAIKADGALSILGGKHLIEDSEEGLEGHTVHISGGDITITARDDGINASGGGDIDPRQLRDPGGENHWIKVTGGNLTIIAQGDGMDANGDLTITGGDIRVLGAESGRDGALDAHGDISVSGGRLMAFGAADEAQAALDMGQAVSLVMLNDWMPGGQEVSLVNNQGVTLLSFTPAWRWNSVVLSHPDIEKGGPCTLWAAGEKVAAFVMGE